MAEEKEDNDISNYVILADDREKKIIPHLTEVCSDPKKPLSWKICRLTHADYVITISGKIALLIERKSWSDLSASILDKRILNIENLLIFRQRIGCKVMLIVEGKQTGKAKGGVTFRAMRGKIMSLMLKHNILVDYTNSLENTAERIAEIVKSLHKMEYKIENSLDEHRQALMEITGSAEQCDEIIEKRKENAKGRLWYCIPRIDIATASAIKKAGYKFHDLMRGKISKTDLAAIKYPGGTIIGAENASKILKGIESKQTNEAILDSINGISKHKRNAILAKYESVSELIDNFRVRNVSEIIYGHRLDGNDKKIGRALAEKIRDTLIDDDDED